MHNGAMSNSFDLKAIRLDRGENQEEFAKHFGVAQTTIHRWETDGIPARGPARMVIERFVAENEATKADKAAAEPIPAGQGA